MQPWSFSGIRPKLDAFFRNLRASLEARADSGVDRHRLETFLDQTKSLQERLYACLEREDRTDLPDLLKEVQVLAYRTRVLFGNPLPAVSWGDVQTLVSGGESSFGSSAASSSYVLQAKSRAAYASRDLNASRREGALPQRTLLAPHHASVDGELASATDASLATQAPLDASLVAPPDEARLTSASQPEEAAPDSEPTPDPEPPAPPAAGGETETETEAETEVKASRLDFLRVPYLFGVLSFLLGLIAGAILGGVQPWLTAVACGVLAVLASRREARGLSKGKAGSPKAPGVELTLTPGFPERGASGRASARGGR